MRILLLSILLTYASGLTASGIPTAEQELERLLVFGSKSDSLIGESDSASEGVVGGSLLEQRPVSRPGELLEFVPGLIATQHSGEGKGNQFFLRGFDLDHGTDFAISVDGLPVNMPTHAHGQGYIDINFLIPELVEVLAYRKGPYYAGVGDFSSAGSADFHYRHSLEATEIKLEAGEFGHRRVYGATSFPAANGELLVAGAFRHYDGPFEVNQDINQFNGLIKYTRGNHSNGSGLTLQLYDNTWNSPDQIPQRAVARGTIDRFGFIDPSVGGDSHRHSLSFDWYREIDAGHATLTAYAIDYRLDLFSNFTYFLDDPVNGDQFQQFDDRTVYGLDAALTTHPIWAGPDAALTTGVQVRHDDIDEVGLFRTRQRQRLSTISQAAVDQSSIALHASLRNRWSQKLRSVLGLRLDHYRFDVDAGLEANSGRTSETSISPKLSLILGPYGNTEWFFNAGRGFHSNDARGTSIRVDPADGVTPVEQVEPLAHSWGAEIGTRSALAPGLQAALSLWWLSLESELVFEGDEGNTEPSGRSRRYGAELSLYYRPTDWLLLDADYAYSHARFTNAGGADHVPLAVGNVLSLGATLDNLDRFGAGLRLRHVGSAPLVEDNSVRSSSTTLLNANVTYNFNATWRGSVALFNALGSDDNDIAYFYTSRLSGEPIQGVEDIHFHPVEPRNVRVSLTARF